MSLERGSIAVEKGSVSAVWHHADTNGTYLVLGHGAGGNLHTPSLAQFAEAISARGVGVVRFNFPYAEARKKIPDQQKTLEACYRSVAATVAARASRVVLGGRSMGGRIASHIVAGGVPAAGLVFHAYPLHPPGKPERLRDAHLAGIGVPMLFIQGSRDPFARPDLLGATMKRLPTATLHLIEGAGHSLTVRGRDADSVLQEVVDATLDWLERL